MSYRSILALSLLGCSVEPPAPIDDPDPPIDQRFEALAKAIDAERAELGASGAAVLVLEHGEVTFAHGFGTKHPDRADAVDANTLFRIGSVTKMMTAVALLERVGAGAIDLDAPLTTAIPGLASAGANRITLRHLLTHSSGLDDFAGELDSSDKSDGQLAAYTSGEYTRIAYQMAPEGRFWNYANPNFSLAGLVVEKLDGMPYREAMHDRVFAPLGMTRTVFRGDEVKADGNYAFGKVSTLGTPMVVDADGYDSPWSRPAGFAWASVYDMAKFTQFLLAGNTAVLPDQQHRAMQSPQISTKIAKDFESYGYGLLIDEGRFLDDGFHSTPIVFHDGAIPGYSAEMYYVPSTGFAFIAFANTDGAYFPKSLDLAFETFAGLPAPTTAPDLSVDPSTFPSLAGTYQDDHNVGRVIVTATTSGVTVSMPDLDAAQVPYEHALEPIDPDNFLLTIEGSKEAITFIRDANGNAEFFRDRIFVARRTTSPRAIRATWPDRDIRPMLDDLAYGPRDETRRTPRHLRDRLRPRETRGESRR